MAFIVTGVAFGVGVLVALAMSVLLVRADFSKQLNRALAVFLFAWALTLLGQALFAFTADGRNDAVSSAWYGAGEAAGVFSSTLMLALVAAVAKPQTRWLRRMTGPGVIGAAAVGMYVVSNLIGSSSMPWLDVGIGLLLLLFWAGSAVAMFVISARSTDSRQADTAFLLGTGLAISWLYWGARDVWWFMFGWERLLALDPGAVVYFLGFRTIAVITALVVGAFIWRATRNRWQSLRWLVILCTLSACFDTFALAAGELGLVDIGWKPSYEWSLAPFAVWMSMMPPFMAFMILRGQMPGIAGAFRVGVSRSTIAAIFVAVFFIVSEAAQTFFGQESGNEYFGIAAAGLLVLGIAPLQRFADKVADTAIPSPSIQGNPNTRFGAYLTLLRKVLADGKVTPREERALASAATAFGITPEEAFDMREEALAQP